MYELCFCDYCETEFKTKKIKKEPYKNLCPRCKRTVLGKKCLWCGDSIEREDEGEPKSYYCGYCEAVHVGKPDKDWLPSVTRDEIDKKGFHDYEP